MNPEVGDPIDKLPTCSVPGIGVPGLYAKGLANAIYIFIYKYTGIKKGDTVVPPHFPRRENITCLFGLG